MKQIAEYISLMILCCNANFWIWGIVILEGLSLISLSILFWKRSSDKWFEKKLSRSKYLKTKWDSLNNINTDLLNSEKKLHSLESRVYKLQSELNHYKEKKAVEQNPNQSEKKIQIQKYLKRRSGKVFNQVSDNPKGCFFRLFNQHGNRAKFEFCGNEEEAIANRDAIFDMICETAGICQSAQHVVTEIPGELELQNNKWVVIKKAQIKFV
jgi:hypothetical protein